MSFEAGSARRNVVIAMAAVMSLAISATAGAATPKFTESAPQLGLSNIGYTYCLVADDFDGDGDIDLFEGNEKIQSQTPSRLYENDGSGHFAAVPNTPFGFVNGACWFDMDADGDLDAVMWSSVAPDTNLKCLENIGNLQFVDVTAAVGLSGIVPNVVDICDYDGDSWLDLVVARQGAQVDTEVWCRRGGAYVLAHALSTPTSTPTTPPDMVSAFDWDRDLDPDLLVRDWAAYWSYDPHTYSSVNDGGSPAPFTTASIPDLSPWGTFAWTDVDLDGDWDFFCGASDYHGGANHLMVQTGPGIWADRGGSAGLHSPGNYTIDASWGDFDLDGYPDLFEPRCTAFAGYTTSALYRNNGNVTFTDVTAALGMTVAQYVVPTVWFDVDADGDLDLLVGRSGDPNGPADASKTTNLLFRNDTTGLGHWLQVALHGQGGNRFGRGAEVSVHAGGRQLLATPCGGSAPSHSGNPQVMTIGLASATVADSIIVRWRSGTVTRLYGVAVDQRIVIDEVEVSPELAFTNVTAEYPGLDDYGAGNSVAWIDFEDDGDLDLSVGAGANNTNRLFLNRLAEDGAVSFESFTDPLVANANTTRGLGWGLFDDDDRCPDLYQGAPYSPNVLVNNACGTISDATDAVTAGGTAETGGVRLVDFDRDGRLDIHEMNLRSPDRLLRNLGNWQFQELQPAVFSDVSGSIDAAWSDVDGDGDQDVYVGRDGGHPNRLLRNLGNGSFFDATPPALALSDRTQGVSWGDYDNDGDMDLFVANWLSGSHLFRNDGDFVFTDVTVAGMYQPRRGQSALWGDLNNDGWLDLYVVNQGEPNQLWMNLPDGNGGRILADATLPSMAELGPSTGAALGDYDADGDLDIYVGAHLGPNTLLRNELAHSGHWLQVKLVGTVSNPSAMGARLRLTGRGLAQTREVGAGDGFWSQGPLTQHFGLGRFQGSLHLNVRWPSGAVSDVAVTLVDRIIVLTEPVGASGAGTDGALASFGLQPCSPNPFNPLTTIAYDLPAQAEVDLAVFDMQGRLVSRLVSGESRGPGRHEVVWSGTDDQGRSVAAGVYIYRLTAGSLVDSRRMTLLK